jgi:1-phosphofructokinase
MIVTLTANPSVDRTVDLGGQLVRGEVQRAVRVRTDPGGKGVNVARAIVCAGELAVAVLPSRHDDPLVLALRDANVPYRAVPVPGPVRVNVTITEPDGVTTKINDPGLALGAGTLEAMLAELAREAVGARWAALSGSLPPGVPADWYATVVRTLRGRGTSIAVDTSGDPLAALLAAGPGSAPDLLKPNAEELAELTGCDVAAIESDPEAAAAAARTLLARGVRSVLATLGGHGAVLVDADGAWFAAPPPTVVRSTVGAGDSALAGYLLADLDGADAAGRLRRAVAYGAAAASLPGSTAPAPADANPDAVRVVRLDHA